MLDAASGLFKKKGKCSIGIWISMLGFYSLIVFFSPLWSPYEGYNISTIHALFYSVFIPLLMAFLAQFYVKDKNIIAPLSFHAAIACIFLSIASLVHFLTYHGQNIKELRGGFGGLANPNAMAIFLVLNVSLLLFALYKGFINKKLIILALGSIFIGVLATISRKGFITLGLTYLIFFSLHKKIKALLTVIIIFALMTGVILTHRVMSQRYSDKAIQTQFAGKWNMTVAGFKMFLKKPLYGWGFRGYYNKFGEYFPYSYRKKYDAHNNYITALANYGIFGFIPFAGIFLYPLLSSMRTLRQSNSHFQSTSAVALIAMLVPFMASAWVAGALMYQPIIVNLFYFYIVLFLCHTKTVKKSTI